MESAPLSTKSRRAKFFISRLMPLLLLLAGATAIGFGGLTPFRAQASKSWPTEPGVVVSSSVERREGRREGLRDATYYGKIQYEFSVNGVTFKGNRVAYGSVGADESDYARRVVSRYPEGAAVTVSYMPGKPEECVLEPGLNNESWLILLAGLIFCVGGVAAIVCTRERGPHPDAAHVMTHLPFSIYPSRGRAVIAFVLGLLFFAIVMLISERMSGASWVQRVLFYGVPVIAIVAGLKGALFPRPLIVVYEDGLAYSQMGLKKLPWTDIQGTFLHEDGQVGRRYRFSPTESDRRLDVLIAPESSALHQVKPLLRHMLRKRDEAVVLPIGLMGAKMSTRELQKVIDTMVAR